MYRIFYYDCEPSAVKFQHPITGKNIDFSKTDEFKFRHAVFDELKKKRKVALRLGYLQDRKNWKVRPEKHQKLLRGTITYNEIDEHDVTRDLVQKGIDIKIGVDIASLALKKQVNQIVLVSGDSDFVPAAKLARREGVDFILDPLWNPINSELHEHIDGLRSVVSKPSKS